MAEKPKGISQEIAEAYALLGIPYEGYVEGIGYQSLMAFTMGSCYFQERGCAIPQFEPVMDCSPEMRIQSVGYKHLVKAGETLASISQYYGATIASIMAANPSIEWTDARNNGELIFVGEELTLPNGVEGELMPKDLSASTCMFQFSASNEVRGMMEGGAANGGGGKGTLDQFNYLASLKATGASAYYSAKLSRWSMYRPLESSILSLRGSSKYMSAFKGVNVAKGFGFGLTGVGVVYDYTIGVPRYNKGIRDEWSVSPQKAGLNTGVALYSLTFNPAVGILYFGIDAFYPGGLGGYMNDTDKIIQRNQEILGPGWNMYRMEGGLK